MSFAAPLVLLALLAIPLLALIYWREQRRRAGAAEAFAAAPLLASVAPNRPGNRRHTPMAVFSVAIVALVLAAAQPQHSTTVPVNDGAVMLLNDASSSMQSTDVAPSRLVAAERAAARFARSVTSTVRVGLMKFTEIPTVLQSPTTDHGLVVQALSGLHAYGHTAIGRAIELADQVLLQQRSNAGKKIPGAIVLLSDGGSDIGVSPITAAKLSKQHHIPIYTVALGTSRGVIDVPRGHGKSPNVVPVPIAPATLTQIGRVSGGQAFTVGDASHLSAVYAQLAKKLGHKRVESQITQAFAGAGLVLLLLGSALSLNWFGRPA
jgi:Ca-activated chloride channel family protein